MTGGESPPVGADLPVRAAGVGLLILACGPAWVARSALATIPGDYDGGPLSHVAVAVPAFALAVGMVYYGLQVWGVRAVWCGAAALLLPAAWLPSASTVPLAAELALTAAVAVAGAVCAVRSVRR